MKQEEKKTVYYPDVKSIDECDKLLRVLYGKANRKAKGKSKVTVVKRKLYDRIEELKSKKTELEKSITEHKNNQDG